MDPESEEIKQENNIDKYASRPSILKEICLADYVSLTDIVYCHKQIQSDDEMSIMKILQMRKIQTQIQIQKHKQFTHTISNKNK